MKTSTLPNFLGIQDLYIVDGDNTFGDVYDEFNHRSGNEILVLDNQIPTHLVNGVEFAKSIINKGYSFQAPEKNLTNTFIKDLVSKHQGNLVFPVENIEITDEVMLAKYGFSDSMDSVIGIVGEDGIEGLLVDSSIRTSINAPRVMYECDEGHTSFTYGDGECDWGHPFTKATSE